MLHRTYLSGVRTKMNRSLCSKMISAQVLHPYNPNSGFISRVHRYKINWIYQWYDHGSVDVVHGRPSLLDEIVAKIDLC